MKHSDYLKNKKTRETRKKIISVISAIVVFITTYALVLPAITLDVSRASREPGIAYEQMQFKATASAASVTAADSTMEEAQVEEPAAEEAAEEEIIEEEAAEIPEEETSAVSDENEKEEAEQVVEEAPAESAREEAPAAEAEEVQEEEDKSAEEKADAEPSSEPAQEEAQTAETQKSADQAVVDQSGKSGTQATEAAAAASTEETAAEFQIPTLDPIDFDEILTGKTDFYFYHVEKTEEDENITSDSVDDWKKVSSDTVLAPEDFVRVYLSYEIPAGSLNETNAEARYRLPAGLELSDKQIKDINKYENGIAASKSGREHDKYLGAEAIEGSRTPNEKAGDEYISATVKVEKTNDGGQELVFTFIPYTVEKNQISYDEAGKLTSEGRNVKGFFTFDLTTAQIDFEKTEKETVEKEDGTKEEIQYSRAEVVFVKENNKKNIDEISRILTMAGPSEKEEPQVQEPKTLISKGEGNDYTVTVSYTDDAQIPDNAELAVREIEKDTDEYASYLEQAKGAVDENKSVNEARFFDITIVADGEKIEPQAPVNVQITFTGIEQTNTDDTQLLHYKDDKEVEVMDQAEFSKSEEPENETKAVDTVQFETDGFSVYGIVGTETIVVDYLTDEGTTYEITVDLSNVTNIPNDAYLDIRELSGDEYDQYLAAAAAALGKDLDSITKAKLFDITIKNGDGEIEPNGKVNVEIVLKDDVFEDATIVHFGNETEVLNATTDGNSVSFETDSFSVYAVIDGSSDENARAAVEFYNGDTKIATMYVKNGDVLLGDGERQSNVSYLEDIVVDPGVGTIEDDELFRGWTTNADYTVADANSAMTIEGVREYLAENIIGSITEGDTVKIYAMIYKYFDVTYFGLDEGISLGSDTVLRLRDEEQASYQVSMPFTAESNAKFMGWKAIDNTYTNIVGATDPETVYPNTTNITITDDIVFKVYAPTGHWLVYYENAKGATYNAPGFFLDDENTVQPANATAANMHRNGYSFSGWYKLKDGQELTDEDKDEDGNYIIGDKFEAFTFGSPLEPVVTNIYAKWTPNTQAPYTIVFWTENIDSINSAQADKKYDLTASYTGTGPVGQNIPYTFVNNGDEDYVSAGGNDYHYTGFSLIPDSVNQQVTITPEGDAVLNLYYNRIQYDLRFYLYRRNGNGANDYQFANNSAGGNNIWGIVNWHNSTNINNMPATTYPGGIQSESGVGGNNITGYYIVLSAYYGEDISDRWPTYDLIGSGTDNTGTYAPVSYVMMVGTKLKPNPSTGGDGTLKGVYNRMDENILGATNDADGNFLIVRFNTYNDWTYHCYYEAYDGQDLTGKTTRVVDGKTYYLDHDFNTRSSNTRPQDQNPPQYAGFTAVMQSASRPYYDQVYIDGVLNGSPQAYSVSGHDAELNYYYKRLEYPIHYMDGVYVGGSDNTNILGSHPDQELHTSANIPYDAEIPEADKIYEPDPSSANEPGFVFEGWYADAACKVPYNFTVMPNNPIVVYAKWVQIQYRVFLHPNAEDSSTNPDLNWGNDDQEMNFRISYGGKVSTPTGVWTGGRKEFVAWFTDEACENEIFDGDVFVLNEDTVTAEYDKSDADNYTDDMDKWGNGATYNKDTDRWWITKKLDVYAKWRTVLVGADGIDVVYVAQGTDSTNPETSVPGTVNGTDTYQDPLKYLDKAGAVAGQAAVPTDEVNYQFLHWVLQRWDPTAGETGEFVDVTDEHGELVTVFPGDSFTVLEEYAKIVETVPDDPDTPNVIETKCTYTVQLRAEYAPNELAKPTYINWFKNDQDPSALLHEDKDLQINEATDIYTVVDGNAIPTREGYKFLGWGRESEYDLDDEGNPIPETHHTAYLTLTEADLYLKYVEPTDTTAAGYQAKNKAGSWVNVTQVAADEALPYHAMYAIWEKNKYSVTVIKQVESGLASDQSVEFTFTPAFPNGLGSDVTTDFKLSGNDNTKIFNDGNTGTPETKFIPYESVFSITEQALQGFELESVTGIYTDDEGTEHTITNLSNGSSITLLGDTVITFKNKRSLVNVVVKKELDNPYIADNNGRDFSFTATWGASEQDTFTVNSTNEEGYTIENVLAGSTMVITEAADTEYEYLVSAIGQKTSDTDNIDNTYTFIVPSEDETVTFTNTVVTTGINVNKTDDQTPAKGLPGAVFDLTRNTKLDGTGSFVKIAGKFNTAITSGENGVMVTVDDTLPVGVYKLTETHTPDGYIIENNEVVFTVSKDSEGNATITLSGDPPNARVIEDGKTLIITNKAGQALPMTGGSGTLPYTLGGLMLVIASALMYGFRLRRRERRFN